VYVVVAPVALMMERSVTKGRRNSEQNAVALRTMGEGLSYQSHPAEILGVG
jgi:hypothetical protein